MTSYQSTCVQLGFSEPILNEDSVLVAHRSPIWKDWDGGKIGGKPCWINPRDIPTKALRCSICAHREKDAQCTTTDSADEKDKDDKGKIKGTILRFLAQIYSPANAETNNEAAFHRSFYVFCCPHPLCSSSEDAHQSVVVLRGQMSRNNDFYPYDCGDGDDDDDNNDVGEWNLHNHSAWDVHLCEICGQFGKGKCPLSKLWFCGKEHQKYYHKFLRASKENQEDELEPSSLIYVESELVVEEEPLEEKKSDDDEKNIARKMNKNAMFADTDDIDDDGDDDGMLEQNDLNEMTGIGAMGGTSDQVTMDFYTRIGRAGGDLKSQCLRYCRWPDLSNDDEDAENGPLWVSSRNQPNSDKDIPLCQHCGAERKFEFQLMPQIIHILTEKSRVGHTVNGEAWKDENALDDGQQALLTASDIINKAKEDGKEDELPAGFETTQKDLVEKLKDKVMNSIDRDEDNIDFGTISVYTCTESCGDGKTVDADSSLGAYRQEFAWRQPPL